nr:extensin-like [Arachis hypogaea]
MRKKTIAKRPLREKVYKLPIKPSSRSQDRTFTPSPSPPTSPPRTTPMARTKTTPRYLATAKPTRPLKATPSKPPGSAKPSYSKGKRPAAEEPVPEPTQPKSRVVLDDEDDDFVPEDSPSLSTEGTSISTGKKSALLNVVKDIVQEFVSQSNHLIAISKEQRKLDEDPATDVEEKADSEGNGSDA